MKRPWPLSLRFTKSAQKLTVRFEDGSEQVLSYKLLRLNSPSAEVQGHGGGPKPPPPEIPADLQIEKAEPVGRYAVRLFFSDGHSSGLYTWDQLYRLGKQAETP